MIPTQQLLDQAIANCDELTGVYEMTNHLGWMQERQFDSFLLSVGDCGLQDPITKCEGLLVDGRHRLMACFLMDVKPKWEEFRNRGDGYIDHFIATRNFKRQSHETIEAQEAEALNYAVAWLRSGEDIDVVCRRTGCTRAEILAAMTPLQPRLRKD